MAHQQTMGFTGSVLALIAACAMCCVAYFINPPLNLQGDMGICLHSPNLWGLTPFVGWLVNCGVIVILVTVLYLVNKEFSFVPGSDGVLTGMFMIMVTSCPWISGMLTTSELLALGNLICLFVLFGCYRKRNATQEIFLIASILSLGSMIQYAFIFMMPVYLIGAMMMKCFNFKCFVAYLMGLMVPYWIGVGLGIIPLSWFTMPTFTNLFDGFTTNSDLIVGLVNIGLTLVIGFFLALNNLVKLYAGNTQRRSYNMVINLLGVACLACILLDFNNMLAYMATAYMITAIQLANLMALRNVRGGSYWLIAIAAAYCVLFTVQVLI